MAAPNEDTIQAQGNRIIWWLQNNLKHLRFNTENVEGNYDDIIGNIDGEFASVQAAGADVMRRIQSQTADPRVGRAMMDAVLREYAKQQNFPETDPLQILDRLFIYFAEGSERVLTRTFTYGAASSGAGTGDGTVNRLTIDRYGFTIENASPEAKTLRCVADKFSGSLLHQEVFEVRGEDVPRDFVSGHVGPQRQGRISCISADDSLAFVNNPSFNGVQEDTLPAISAITDWTVTTSISNFENVLTDSYRTADHEGAAPASLRFKANDKITQNLNVVRPTLNTRIPYYCQIAWKAENSADGTLTLRVGSNSAFVSVTGSAWTVLRLALDENLYLRNFNATTLDIEVEWSGRSTGELLVDDLVFAPMTKFDGTFWAIVGGATPYLIDRIYTTSDTVAESSGIETSINQKWLWYMYNRYLPHDTTASGNVTWPEAS